MLDNKSKVVVSPSCCLIFKTRARVQKKKKKHKKTRKNKVLNAGAFLYGSVAASAPYTDKYLLTQMKLVKAIIPGVQPGIF